MTNLEINKAYVGNTEVDKILLGSTVIYSAGPAPQGYYVIIDNNTYNLTYDGFGNYETDIPESGSDWEFTLWYNGAQITASTYDRSGSEYYDACLTFELHECEDYTTDPPSYDCETDYDVSVFSTGLRVNHIVYDPSNNSVTAYTGFDAPDCGGDPECECNCQGGYWDAENQECIISSCEDRGECGDYPDCYPCEEPDPCEDWEGNGYSSWEDCECQNYGEYCDEESGEETDPCEEDPCNCVEPGTEEECNCNGGEWDGENCN